MERKNYVCFQRDGNTFRHRITVRYIAYVICGTANSYCVSPQRWGPDWGNLPRFVGPWKTGWNYKQQGSACYGVGSCDGATAARIVQCEGCTACRGPRFGRRPTAAAPPPAPGSRELRRKMGKACLKKRSLALMKARALFIAAVRCAIPEALDHRFQAGAAGIGVAQ